jgi:DNA-directed RNA polymerase subunit M/transcription elongation factor TFIIS
MPPKKSSTKSSAAAAAVVAADLQTIVFTAKGDIKKAKLPLTDGCLSEEAIQTYLKKKTEPTQLGKYSHEGVAFLLYGYTEGKSGTENKYEFPPPYDSLLPFGDVLLIVSSLQRPSPYSQAQWEIFYEQAMGGFELLGGTDEEEVAEEVVDEDEEAIDAAASENGDEEEELDLPPDDDEEEEEKPVRVETKKKKAVAASSLYQKQVALASTSNFVELDDADAVSKSPIRQRVTSFLAFLTDLDFGNDAAQQLECGIYKAACADAEKRNVIKHWDNTLFATLYQTIVRTMCSHLDPASPIRNQRLLERLKNGELTLAEIPHFSPQELFPENWKELADRQAIREQKLLEGNKGMATDRYKCGRCGKRECSYYEMQTRSADEPMTIFISCLNCGKRWRQ